MPGTSILDSPIPSVLGICPCYQSGPGVFISASASLVAGSGLAQPTLAGQDVGLVLSSDCQPIQSKLVEKVLSGQTVEMQEFLADNDKLVDSLGATPRNQCWMREVSSPLAWLMLLSWAGQKKAANVDNSLCSNSSSYRQHLNLLNLLCNFVYQWHIYVFLVICVMPIVMGGSGLENHAVQLLALGIPALQGTCG